MNTDLRLPMLNVYIQSNVAPILLEEIPFESIVDDPIVLPATMDSQLLNGHYVGTEFCPPAWFLRVQAREEAESNILVIDQILDISPEEQMKFYELLKYRKIGVFDLPKNCVIMVTCTEFDEKLMNKTIYSLMAHI